MALTKHPHGLKYWKAVFVHLQLNHAAPMHQTHPHQSPPHHSPFLILNQNGPRRVSISHKLEGIINTLNFNEMALKC